MKDWFYLPNSEIVAQASRTTKAQVVLAIKRGSRTLGEVEAALGIAFTEEERPDVEYLIRVYAPLSYENQSGCQGCDGCAGGTTNRTC